MTTVLVEAGKCYTMYRQRGGAKRSPLPNFYIGAHAAVSGLTLLTCDAGRYQSYFPTIDLVAPIQMTELRPFRTRRSWGQPQP